MKTDLIPSNQTCLTGLMPRTPRFVSRVKRHVSEQKQLNSGIHYYYQCPTCSKTYLAYQRMGNPIEWTSLEKEVWEKRIANVRGTRVSVLRKGLDEQKAEIHRVHTETSRKLKEITLKKAGVINEIEKKNMLLEQLKRDEEELEKKINKENEDLDLINQKIENLTMSQPLVLS
jgi:hypothetical protein